MSGRRRHAGGSPHDFPAAAREALADEQLRANMGRATQTIRARRAAAVAELADFEELREQARRIKDDALGRLDELLARFEAAATAAGAQVHHAPDAAAACAVVADIARRNGVTELVKMKSLATDEIRLDAALAEAGVEAVETDLAELIVQLAGDTASHILVPAVHYSRGQIRDIFRRTIAAERELSDDPSELAEVSRLYLRERFLRAGMGVTGCNIAVAETGTVCVVENEGNGRMVTTLPPVLVSVVGIEKVVPSPADLGLLLRLLPRSATGERMSSYVSLLTGVTSGDGPLPADGPREYHIVLLDNGRRNALADPVGRQALRCIRCSACLNVCPVYTRVGGHAYGSIYPGPIGAILTPQLWGMEEHAKLPFASTLCGACAEVCPVGIDIPGVLLYLRARAVREQAPAPEKALFGAAAWTFGSPRRFAAAQRAGRAAELPLVRGGLVRTLPPPLAGWSEGRDLRPVARETFREWWARERGTASGAAAAPPDAGEVPWGGGAVTPGVPESRAADPAVPESRAGADLLGCSSNVSRARTWRSAGWPRATSRRRSPACASRTACAGSACRPGCRQTGGRRARGSRAAWTRRPARTHGPAWTWSRTTGSRRPSWTRSTARSPAARSRWRRRGRWCSPPAQPTGGEPSPWSRTSTSAWSARTRSCRTWRRRWSPSPRSSKRRAGRWSSSPARPPRPTSSCTGWRVCTVRGELVVLLVSA